MQEREKVEALAVAAIYKDPLILSEIKLSKASFLTQDGSFYFSLAKHLYKKGFKAFDEVTVLSNVSETIEKAFTERGGWATIQKMIDVINTQNQNTYLDHLYRENIILSLHKNGFNLLEPVEHNGKNVVPIELFRKMDSENILDWYEAQLASMDSGFSSKVLEDEDLDFDEDFIESCLRGEETGVPFDIAGEDVNNGEMSCFPFLSRQINGFMDGTLNVLGGYSNVGKTTLMATILMGLLYRGRKILIISNEQKIKIFKATFLSLVLYKYFRYYNVTRKKMLNGDLNGEDLKMIEKAREWWRTNYRGSVKFVSIADADMNIVKKQIREKVLKSNCDVVWYDTFKIDFAGTSKDKEYISLIKDSRELDKIAKKYNIIVIASLQLAINTQGKLFLDASVLSMSKQIKEVCETLLLMREVYAEELDDANKKYYCRPFRLVKINGKWVRQEHSVDPAKTYRMLFVDKARNGVTSGDNGVAYLLAYNGGQGVFQETAQCRPKHGRID